jgi:AcrR family transcriptional regulator
VSDATSTVAAGALVERARLERSEMMLLELERVALELFEARGFGEVTVDEIATAGGISARTFYRYFPAKDDVLQVRIDQRAAALRVALAARPADEPPLRSLRLAYEEVAGAEDPVLVRRWIDVVASTPGVVRSVLGGIQLKCHPVTAEFLGARLGQPGDGLVTTMLAAAAGGVVQAAQTRWFLRGGDLAGTISEALAVLEGYVGNDPSAWTAPGVSSGRAPADRGR